MSALPLLLLVLALFALGPVAGATGTAPTGAREFALEFSDGLLWLQARADKRPEPLVFLLDSGASTSVLHLDTARRLGLHLGPACRVDGVGRTAKGYWPVPLKLHAGGLELPNEFLALDLGSLSRACRRPVEGLLGADFFRGRVIEVDYLAGRLRVLPASEGGPKSEVEPVPMHQAPHSLRVALRVNDGAEQWFRVDTGCASALQWVPPDGPARDGTRTQAVGLTELAIPQTMTGVRIRNRHVDMVPTGLHRKPIFPGESGLLGNGLLAQFGVVTFDLIAGRLLLGRR